MNPALHVRDLSVRFRTYDGTRQLVKSVSFALPPATCTAIIGESGSGKTTLASAVTRLFPQPNRYEVTGSVRFGSTDLLAASANELRDVRRHRVRYILQEPSESMNPLLRIEIQLREAFPSLPSRTQMTTLLERVGLTNPEAVLRSFPHELSVGMLQRVAIAMAIAPEPDLLIADEPTSALDQPMRIQMLDLLRSVQAELQCSMLVVTHDPSFIERFVDRVMVMFGGKIVEVNERGPFGRTARHPYSRQLTGVEPPVRPRSVAIASGGCAFASRCPRVQERCMREEPELTPVSGGSVRCFYWK